MCVITPQITPLSDDEIASSMTTIFHKLHRTQRSKSLHGVSQAAPTVADEPSQGHQARWNFSLPVHPAALRATAAAAPTAAAAARIRRVAPGTGSA